MKKSRALGLVAALLLAGCASWNRPYISGEDGCDEIVDARARLDCLEAADRAEDEWREDLKRKQEEQDKKEDLNT